MTDYTKYIEVETPLENKRQIHYKKHYFCRFYKNKRPEHELETWPSAGSFPNLDLGHLFDLAPVIKMTTEFMPSL